MMYYRRSGLPWVLAAGLPSSMGSLGSLGDWVPWAPGYLGSLGSICSVFLYAGKLIDTISFRTVQCCSCIMWGRFWLKIQDVGLQKVIKYLDKFKFICMMPFLSFLKCPFIVPFLKLPFQNFKDPVIFTKW